MVAERIRAYAGLDPPGWLLEARLDERAKELGLDEAAYLSRAAGDDAAAGRELEALSELLRVGETRFFRHRAHVAALEGRVLPERARAAQLAGRKLRAWSAGCASGEEAWTLAMLLDAAAPPCGFEVLATDLSDDALDEARAGRYSEARVGDVPAELRARYFSTDGDRKLQCVTDGLRAHVTFQKHNLLQPRYPAGFDLILCRNVLIYFDALRRADVIERLAQSLHDGGYLFVGYSESLRDQAHFEQLRDEDGVIYRRRSVEAMRRREPPAPPPPPAVNAALKVRVDVALNASHVRKLQLRGDYHDPRRLAAELKPIIAARHAVVDLDGAEYLGDEAARVLQRATEAAPGLELRARRPAVLRWLERHNLSKAGRR